MEQPVHKFVGIAEMNEETREDQERTDEEGTKYCAVLEIKWEKLEIVIIWRV